MNQIKWQAIRTILKNATYIEIVVKVGEHTALFDQNTLKEFAHQALFTDSPLGELK